MMARKFVFGLAAMLVMGPLFHVQAAGAAEVTLKLGHAVFESHPNHDTAVRFRDAVARLSNGEIDMQIFPARQLGDVKELMEGVQFGTVDMTVNSSSALADIAPEVNALQLPWLISSYDHFAALAITPEAAALTAGLSKVGIVSLGIYDGGERHFLSTRRQIASLADFAGQKTRVPPVKLFLDVWGRIGVNPTPMAYSEVYTALETGALDAAETNLTSVYSEKYYEIAKHVTLTGHNFWPSLLLINQATFDSLRPEHQQAMRQAAAEIVRPQVMAVKELDAKLLVDLKALGVEITSSSPELMAQMKQAVQPIYEDYLTNPTIRAFVEKAASLQSASAN